MDENHERLHDIDEVSAWLKIPRGTLYNWNYRGVGPRVTKVGQAVRYRRSDVLAWLESGGDVRAPRRNRRKRAS